jgi:hypothetical protein
VQLLGIESYIDGRLGRASLVESPHLKNASGTIVCPCDRSTNNRRLNGVKSSEHANSVYARRTKRVSASNLV